MANTYVAIATVTVGSGGASYVEFTSIPQTYTDLVIKVSARSTQASTATDILMQLNGTTANYSNRRLYGNGSATASNTNDYGTDEAQAGGASSANNTASTFGNTEIYIPNYTSSNNKSWSSDAVTENNATGAYQFLDASLLSNTAAVTSIKLYCGSGNFAQYSTATLYGIKNS
jgi:hypothetical protein